MRFAVAATVTVAEGAISALVLVFAAIAVVIVVTAAFVLVELLAGAFDDFVELTAVEPDAPALRAVINFNSLAIRNGQQDVAFWTIHVV
jgi:hypothetical protein